MYAVNGAIRTKSNRIAYFITISATFRPRLTEARPIIGRLGMVEHMSRVVVSTHSPKPSEPLSRTNFAIKPACGAATGVLCMPNNDGRRRGGAKELM